MPRYPRSVTNQWKAQRDAGDYACPACGHAWTSHTDWGCRIEDGCREIPPRLRAAGKRRRRGRGVPKR